MAEKEKQKEAQSHYIYPCLVYIKEKIQSGELSVEDFTAVVTQNALDHGHEGYKLPEDWETQLPHQVNRFGWKIFELPKVVKQQQEEAAVRRQQKKLEKLAKQEAERKEGINTEPSFKKRENNKSPGNTTKITQDNTQKKKVVVVKRLTIPKKSET